jgi:hypothetical protein
MMRWPTSQQPDPAEAKLRQRFFAAISDDDLDALVGLLELTSDGLLLSQTKKTPLPRWADPIIERIITRTAERMSSKESEAEIEREPIQTDAPSDFASLLSRRWCHADAMMREKLRAIANALGIEPPPEPMRRLRPPSVKNAARPSSERTSDEIAPENPAQEVSRNAKKRSRSDIPDITESDDEQAIESEPQADRPWCYWTDGEGAWS